MVKCRFIKLLSILLALFMLLGLFSSCNKSGSTGEDGRKTVTVKQFVKSMLTMIGYYFYNSDDEYKPYIEKALELGILKKEDVENNKAEKMLTRAKAAQLAIRAAREGERYPDDYFLYYKNIKDYDKVPDDLKDAVLRACVKGIVTEDEDKMFRPLKTVTEEESSEIISRLNVKSSRRIPKPVEEYQPLKYEWQRCDTEYDWMPSPIWAPGGPEFTVETKEKTEGNASVKVTYRAPKNAWYMVGISPEISIRADFYDFDGMEIDFYNPDPYEKNVQIRFDDSYGKSYYLRTSDEKIYNHYGTKSFIPAGPGWVKLKLYFDSVHVSNTMLPADNREMLKDVCKMMFVIQDNGGNSQNTDEEVEGYFLLDNVRFFKIKRTESNEKITRLPETFDASDYRFSDYDKYMKEAEDLINSKDYYNAALALSKIVTELSPFNKAAKEKIISLYTNSLNDEQRRQLKTHLKSRYDYWVTDDLDRAQGITKLIMELVNIYSENEPLFSFGAVTQTIGPSYGFTDSDRLIETATILKDMGTDTIKMRIGKNYANDYQIEPSENVRSLKDLAQYSSYKKVLDMPFDNYVLWTYAFKDTGWWQTGPTTWEIMKAEYEEIYEYTKYLLETYSGTNKTFLLGNWEGDWHLCDFDMKDPPIQRVYAMYEWFKMRQKAVTDARNDTKHHDVRVMFYMELNIFSYADIEGQATRLVNSVLPFVDVDFVSFSSYQVTGTAPSREGYMPKYFKTTMDFIESHIPPADIPGKRLWIGEYGFAEVDNITPEEQDQYMRNVLREGFKWGAPFLLYWQLYCNEYNTALNRNNGFWLINSSGEKTPAYYTIERISKKARAFVEDFKAKNGRKPTQREYYDVAIQWLDEKN